MKLEGERGRGNLLPGETRIGEHRNMLNLKHKLLFWIIIVLVFIGTIDEWFFWGYEQSLRSGRPEPYQALVPRAILHGDPIGIFGVILLGIFPIIGWIYLAFGKDRLKPRLHWFWTPFGLLQVAWAWLTFYGATVLEDPEYRGITLLTLLSTSPEVWRATTFGLLYAFYSLGSAVPLWYFYWGWFVAGVTQGPGMLITDLLPVLLGLGRPYESPYLSPEQAGKFWHYWGFFFLDEYLLPLGLVAGYFIIKWRISVLEKEDERHPRSWGFLEGIGLPFVLLRRRLGLRALLRK